jgi:ABC-type Na+ transport system ATPase subunit NatA
MAAVVEACGLTKRYGALVAVDDLSFELPAGTVTGFLGPNGAGKTTTLRMLLGLAAPDAGTALVFGEPYAHLREPGRRVGVVLEAADLHPGRSGRDHLRTLAVAGGIPRARVEEVLRLVELDAAADRRVKGYSLGMRQRVGLAAALVLGARLLVRGVPRRGVDQRLVGARDELVERALDRWQRGADREQRGAPLAPGGRSGHAVGGRRARGVGLRIHCHHASPGRCACILAACWGNLSPEVRSRNGGGMVGRSARESTSTTSISS